MKKIYNQILKSIISFTLLALVFYSCAGDGSKKTKSEQDDIINETQKEVDPKVMESFNKTKLIFYSLPSPLETAMLIKRTGSRFDAEILNPPNKATKYNTNFKKALNLGVYSADLSYSGMFDQTQVTIQYMASSKILAKGLGITDIINEELIKKIEDNKDNREAVMNIISETFMSSNAYLKENDRVALSVMVLVGGWVEGLYLATNLTKGVIDNNKQLVDRIIYQKLSLMTVISLLESYPDNEDLQNLTLDMYQLKSIFDKVKIVNTTEVEANTNAEKKITTIKSESETFMTQETFSELVKKVKEIRDTFTAY